MHVDWLLAGCYLKLHSTHGVVSSSHLQFNSDHHLPSRSSIDCSLLLSVPNDFSGELTMRKLKLFRPRAQCHNHSLAGTRCWSKSNNRWEVVDIRESYLPLQEPFLVEVAEIGASFLWQASRLCQKFSNMAHLRALDNYSISQRICRSQFQQPNKPIR